MRSGWTTSRLLVCEPWGYGVHHLLNPWMDWTEQVDVKRAFGQWVGLCDVLDAAGVEPTVMPHGGRSGAMTFTRDTAVVVGDGEAIVLRNVGRRGDLEPECVRTWLGDHGFTIEELTEGDRVDGGNVVPTTEGWLIGIPVGASREPARRLAERLRERTGRPVHGIPLATARFGHLDTALADLAGRAWLGHPPAFARPDLSHDAWAPILRDRPLIAVEPDEAEALGCNVVVAGEHVIGGLSTRLCREIERCGLHPVPVVLDEFRKAGGGAHCLTLELDPLHHLVEPDDRDLRHVAGPDDRGLRHVAGPDDRGLRHVAGPDDHDLRHLAGPDDHDLHHDNDHHTRRDTCPVP